jgi:hypothetical protein
MNRRRLVSLVALAAFILAAPLTALGGSPASVCPAGLTGSFPLCSIMPTFAGVNAESRLLPSGELGAETFLRAEDFTTYTEVDGGADTAYTTTAGSVQFTVPRDETSYIYKDFGTDYFNGDFEHRVKVNINGGGIAYVWGLANSLNDFKTIIDASEDYLAVMFNSGNQLAGIFESDGGSSESDTFTYADSTDYYLKIKRDESVGTYGTLYCYVYSDAAYSVLVDTLSIELGEKEDFRYMYVLSSHNNSNATELSGTISNLQLDTANYFDGNLVVKANGGEARFEPDGYLDEPESTNLLKSSRLLDVDDANWTGTVAAEDCVQGETGIDGSANTAWTLTDNDAENYEAIYQLVTKVATDQTPYCASVYVKKTTVSSDVLLEIVFSGGTTDISGVRIDPSTGVASAFSDPTAIGIEDAGDFWRMWVTHSDPTGDNNAVGAYLFPAPDGAADTGSAVFDFAQLENASVATSPIYTTSTAVTRPADSFSLTMTDAFKEKFAEALGSELAPDFGAVLGPELITDENDRTFSDGDVGNWTIGESGSAASLDYDTSSIGGHDDKQIKLTAEAGEDYVLARLTTSYTPDMSAGYYILSAKVYLDPNADQDRIRLYASSFTGSTKIQSLDGAGSDYSTVNKGVWENVYSIFELVSGDLEGSFRIGFFDSGNLTANDICYFDDFSLRKITFSDDWTAGTGWGPKFALTAPSLGDEELSNGDFSSVTEGSDLFDSGVGDYRDNTGSWAEYGTNTVANDSDALLITWVDSDRGAYLLLTDANDLDSDLTVGKQYRLTFYAKVETGESVEVDFYDGDTAAINIDTITATDFVEVSHDFIVLGATPDVHFDAMDAANDKIWVRDFTIKEITPTAPSVYGTPTATAYVETDEDAGTLRIVSDGDSVGVYDPAAISEGQLYFLEVDVASASGYLRVNNTGNKTYDYPSAEGNDVAVIEDAGVFSMVFEGGTANPIYLFCTNPGDDFTINSWSIKPYTPSHSNTDPRFDRQTESNVYTSDFSADEDGWATNYNGTTEGNIDGVDGEDDVLRFTCDDTDGPHIPRYMGGDAFTEGIRVRVRFDYYIPSGNNNLDGIRPGFDNGFITDTLTVTDSWTSVDVYATTEGSRFRIYG